MKKNLILITLTLALISAAPTWAEPTTKAKPVKRETSVRMISSSTEVPHPSDSQTGGLSASLGLGSVSSKFHFGALGRYEGAMTLSGTHLKIGGATGFLLGPDSPTTWSIPILGVVSYDLPHHGGLRPFIGVGLGVAILHSAAITNVAGLGDSASDTTVKIAAMFIPGVRFNDQLYFEMPAGSLGDSFTILPSVGMHF